MRLFSRCALDGASHSSRASAVIIAEMTTTLLGEVRRRGGRRTCPSLAAGAGAGSCQLHPEIFEDRFSKRPEGSTTRRHKPTKPVRAPTAGAAACWCHRRYRSRHGHCNRLLGSPSPHGR